MRFYWSVHAKSFTSKKSNSRKSHQKTISFFFFQRIITINYDIFYCTGESSENLTKFERKFEIKYIPLFSSFSHSLYIRRFVLVPLAKIIQWAWTTMARNDPSSVLLEPEGAVNWSTREDSQWGREEGKVEKYFYPVKPLACRAYSIPGTVYYIYISWSVAMARPFCFLSYVFLHSIPQYFFVFLSW